jgi:hypothetical protein
MGTGKIILLSFLILASCAPGGGSGSGASLEGVAADAQGTWSKDCVASSGGYLRKTLKISGMNAEIIDNFYTSSTCSGTVAHSQTIPVSFVVGQSSTVGSGVNEVDFTATNGAKFYDLIKVDGNQLWVGLKDAAHDSKSLAARPIQLEATSYLKQ